jgi:hypothetical protein
MRLRELIAILGDTPPLRDNARAPRENREKPQAPGTRNPAPRAKRALSRSE